METTIFDVLVRTLDSAERRNLLERILASSKLPQTPLRPPEDQQEQDEVLDLASAYRRLSLLRKLVLLLRSLLTGRDRYELLEQMLLRRLESLIDHRAPDLVHFRRRVFLPRMHDELAALAAALEVLKGPLDLAIRRSREDFVAFLGSIEMPEVQKRLAEESDPERLWQEGQDPTSGLLRAELVRRCEQIIADIPPDVRRAVYADMQALTGLARLARQPFAAMLACFRPEGDGVAVAGLAEMSEYIVGLAEAMAAVGYPPSEEALRALFLFSYGDSLLDGAFGIEGRIEADIDAVEGTLDAIRHFNQEVPLVLIAKYATHDLGFRPKSAGGAEDWFALYRNFWRRRAAWAWATFSRRKMEERLAARAASYLGLPQLPPLESYRADQFDEGITLKHPLSLAFLKGFFQQVFARIARPLRIILANGEFYKSENRSELADSLAYLGLIQENIASFEARLAKGGDLGRELADAKSERRGRSARLRRIRAVAEQADRNASYLVAECAKKLDVLTQVINGVLHGKSSEHYDTLANLSSIGGVGNRLLLAAWADALEQLRSGLGLLLEIRQLEESPQAA